MVLPKRLKQLCCKSVDDSDSVGWWDGGLALFNTVMAYILYVHIIYVVATEPRTGWEAYNSWVHLMVNTPGARTDQPSMKPHRRPSTLALHGAPPQA
jgi:hypothetical protein